MKTLSIDIETYCDLDLSDVGVYKYVSHPSFQVLLFAYAFDNDPVQILEACSYEYLPREVFQAMEDPNVLKTAFNANFERVCLYPESTRTEFIPQWECTMVKASMLGLPMSLDTLGDVLKISQGKLSIGKELIRYFCKPCKPTKSNGQRTRNLPEHAPDKWERFKKYCIRDVEAEREIRQKLSFFSIPEKEKKLFHLDQKINDYGICIDLDLANQALHMDQIIKDRLMREVKDMTGLDNPNSLPQLKKWLHAETGRQFDSLAKDKLKEILEDGITPKAEKVLALRQKLSKTSIKKYNKMVDSVCPDGRVRGLLQFYGASRTGRWAGRLIQVQNLVRNNIEGEELDFVRSMVKSGNLEGLELIYPDIASLLSQLIRTAFVSPEGWEFVISDFSAIEARVIAWLAGEEWVLDVFRTHGKIYEATASKMFDVPLDNITKDLRSKGKVAQLALGYQGSVGALEAMGALKMGLSEDELQPIVNAWRKANPRIVKLWYLIQNAAETAIKERRTTKVLNKLTFRIERGMLVIELPSGRSLYYPGAHMGINHFGSESIKYKGIDQVTRKWATIDTYGGRLTENCVQAIARDCLAEVMLKLDAKQYNINMHVHDEFIAESPTWDKQLKEACEVMSEPLSWAQDLPLTGEGYCTAYYKKD